MSPPRWDWIVVGAGAAGAVLAERLSAGGDARLLLLEAGPDFRTRDTPPDFLYRDTHTATVERNRDFWWPRLEARRTAFQPPRFYARGRGAGGSSTVNGLISIRGTTQDFDGWAAAGAEGWSFEDVLPSFCRMEDDIDFPAAPYHGSGGPIPIYREPRAGWGGMDQALGAAAVALGYGWADDHNAPGATGASPLAMNIREGRRVSTNDAYLEPARGRPNLEVRGSTLVDRVLFDGAGRANGVLTAPGERFELEAGGEVALCAGAVHSPAILLRSGIGPPADLGRLGIQVVADLPVGEGFQDHPAVWFDVPIRPELMQSRGGRHTNLAIRYSSGLAGAGPNDMMVLAMNHVVTGPHAGFSIWVNQCFSRGRIRLAARDPEVDPEVEIRMLEDERDRRRLEDGVDRGREIIESSPLKAIRRGPPGVPEKSQLAALASDAKHSSGGCRMGRPGDPATVVDPDCRVLGVEGLRVADNSIAPEIVRGNTFLTAVMIGEHAVARIRSAALRAS